MWQSVTPTSQMTSHQSSMCSVLPTVTDLPFFLDSALRSWVPPRASSTLLPFSRRKDPHVSPGSLGQRDREGAQGVRIQENAQGSESAEKAPLGHVPPGACWLSRPSPCQG
jgi:hypothetical protein